MTEGKRLPIWKKEDFFLIGDQRIDMDPSVVKLPEKQTLPLTWMYHNTPESLVGQISDIRLEDGEITGEIQIKDDVTYEMIDGVSIGLVNDKTRKMLYEMFDSGEIRLGGFYNKVIKKNRDDDTAFVVRCSLKEVSIFIENSFPKLPKL